MTSRNTTKHEILNIKTIVKEACVENFTDAKTAEKLGANRIELCENLTVGGTTPSFGTIKLCSKKLNIPFFVMIRPRGGNFVYSDDEYEIMKADIKICKKLNVAGVVLGILTHNNQIDTIRTRELVELADPMQVTFHKAFDETTDYRQALEDIISTGAHRILSSGTKITAAEGTNILNEMIRLSNERITIVAAGRITRNNIEKRGKQIHTNEFHGRKIVLPE